MIFRNTASPWASTSPRPLAPQRLRRADEIRESGTLDPSRANVVYVGTTQGLVKSVGGGQTWSVPRLGGRSVSAVAIARTRPQTIYAGVQWKTAAQTWTGGMFASTDRGATWHRLVVTDGANASRGIVRPPATRAQG